MPVMFAGIGAVRAKRWFDRVRLRTIWLLRRAAQGRVGMIAVAA
jgi:hypothetical protein